jgi:Zn-dependent protease with chaperone function
MSKSKSNIQINTLTDRLNYTAHTAAMGATCLGITYYIHSPWVTLTVMAHMIFVVMPRYNRPSKNLAAIFPPTPAVDLLPDSRKLPVQMRRFAKALGIKQTPPLHILEKYAAHEFYARNILCENAITDTVRKEKLEDFNLIRSFSRKYDDASMLLAAGVQNPVVIMTEAAEQTLSAREKRSFCAHELAHIASNHASQNVTLEIIKDLAVKIAGLNFVVVALSNHPNQAVIGASTLTQMIALGYMMRHHAFDPNDPLKARPFTIGCVIMDVGALLATSYFTHKPSVFVAGAATAVVMLGTDLIQKSHKRFKEFRADHIAAQVSRDPEALSSALVKTEDYNIKHEKTLRFFDYTHGSVVLRPLKMAVSLFLDHPPTGCRVHRLAKIARRLQKARAAAPV